MVELRVSQINGCAYCCRLHSEEARKLGIHQEKLDVLAAWKHSQAFSKEEKLVLEWTEAVTLLQESSEEIKKQLSAFYSDREIVDLALCIALMNTFNRLVISLKH